MDGELLIKEICELLIKEDRSLTDTNIVIKIRELNYIDFSILIKS